VARLQTLIPGYSLYGDQSGFPENILLGTDGTAENHFLDVPTPHSDSIPFAPGTLQFTTTNMILPSMSGSPVWVKVAAEYHVEGMVSTSRIIPSLRKHRCHSRHHSQRDIPNSTRHVDSPLKRHYRRFHHRRRTPLGH
jgi:hypothetical protein